MQQVYPKLSAKHLFVRLSTTSLIFFSFQSKCNKFGKIPTLNKQERNVSIGQEDCR